MKRRKLFSCTSGATALEFALALPPFLLLIIGGFQYAWAVHCAATVRWSLEASARKLMLDPTVTAATLKTNMLTLISGRAQATDLTVTITADNSNPGSKLLVASSVYRTTLAMPFMPSQALTFNASTSVPVP